MNIRPAVIDPKVAAYNLITVMLSDENGISEIAWYAIQDLAKSVGLKMDVINWSVKKNFEGRYYI